MIKIGKIQKLKIKRFTSVGAYLNIDDSREDDVLLPKSQIPEEAKVGDEIEVMVYNDSRDRIIATTKRAKAQVGEMAHLMVISQTKIGSFLDWGLEKDLFLPFSETVGSVEKGKEYLVGVYLDKSDRLCATMKIKDMLSTESPYKENDKVKGTIYSINRDIGAFVAVEDKYDGLIPKKELLGVYEVGEIVEVRVTKVKEDGKLDLSLRDRAHLQMDKDSEHILLKLEERDGFLPLNDNTDPERIKKELSMSKSGFKRAIGKLYKEGLITIEDKGIKLK
ncbi:S1 RNA-binding domain-containing protein [Tissierella pigra]|uniref:S1 RNA-binding domain-containing protein n=1 Tax=Tissierella pigra TaxID=2607614 RepID=A0A6N7XW30_9FIRM|nr:S1-like domain-containing RNA-binding protein [Tissierella pigra]MBU5426141.1 S1 RNA-binding domain-containing protein [Tissierella pigra]MSU00744.1 S1 RNA-binding domain-containing protein [Tissierella pigra]